MSDAEERAEIDVLAAIVPLLPLFLRRYLTEPCKTSALTGAEYFSELMESNSAHRFRGAARMERATFVTLLDTLLRTRLLRSSRNIEAGEKLMMFRYVLTGNSNRAAQERWQHSGEPVSRVIREVLSSIGAIQSAFMRPPAQTVPPGIARSPKFSPFFSNCVSAIDGTHIAAVLPRAISAPFRNRKGFHFQNVLADCTFDMVLFYVLTGWE